MFIIWNYLNHLIRGTLPVIKKQVISYFSGKVGGVSGTNTNVELSR
jgi:hypothetical protein